jgi:hypothetical protein
MSHHMYGDIMNESIKKTEWTFLLDHFNDLFIRYVTAQ